jgi:hypothetical protein
LHRPHSFHHAILVALAALGGCSFVNEFAEPPWETGGAGGQLGVGGGATGGEVGGSGGVASAGAGTGADPGVVSLADGEPCTADAACKSGNCVDGVCCNVQCGGPCATCRAPGKIGTCDVRPAGAPSGDGVCNPYACDGITAGCPGTCAGKGQCADPYYCDEIGICQPKLALGLPCWGAQECASGHCVDDRCCESACDGPCEACRSALTGYFSGFCLPVVKGTDPDGECGKAGCCYDGACAAACPP